MAQKTIRGDERAILAGLKASGVPADKAAEMLRKAKSTAQRTGKTAGAKQVVNGVRVSVFCSNGGTLTAYVEGLPDILRVADTRTTDASQVERVLRAALRVVRRTIDARIVKARSEAEARTTLVNLGMSATQAKTLVEMAKAGKHPSGLLTAEHEDAPLKD